MSIETLDDLLKLELEQLYDGKRRLIGALPKMALSSSSERLRAALQEHLEQTKDHVHRLEECFNQIGRNPETAKADGIEELITEGEYLIRQIEQSPLRDADLIGAGKRVEHYEMSAYSATISFAKLLGDQEVARLLDRRRGRSRRPTRS